MYIFIAKGKQKNRLSMMSCIRIFSRMDIYVTPIIHKTKRTPTKAFKGGVSKYAPIKDELIKLCQASNSIVTTMFDYYAMPEDTPSIDHQDIDIYKRIDFIEMRSMKI